VKSNVKERNAVMSLTNIFLLLAITSQQRVFKALIAFSRVPIFSENHPNSVSEPDPSLPGPGEDELGDVGKIPVNVPSEYRIVICGPKRLASRCLAILKSKGFPPEMVMVLEVWHQIPSTFENPTQPHR
jgi:hypothetical protein